MSVKEVPISNTINQWLALGGILGSILFIPVAFLIGESREGYSHLSQGISVLSESGAPHAWAQTGNFIVTGLLIVGLSVGLHRGIGRGSGSIVGPILISAFGTLALILNAIFPADPIGVPETISGTIHSLGAGIGFLSVIAAMFILPRRLKEHKDWRMLRKMSPVFGIASSVLMLSYLFAQEGVVQVWHPWTGLLQRAMGGTVMLWLFLLALQLLKSSRSGEL